MKNFITLIGFLVSLNAAAQTVNPSLNVNTRGTAQLPKQIKVIDGEGKEQTYSVGFTDDRFTMNEDNSFMMGDRTRCDPYIGKTAREMKIAIVVTDRTKRTGYDASTGQSILLPTGESGRAVLTIPKGSNAYGRCQNRTKTLTALSVQTTDPISGENVYDRAFQIDWVKSN